jgi:hypothetical protein
MDIIGSPEKNQENAKMELLVKLNADDSLILEQVLKAFDKYDKDDSKYIAKLESVKDNIHKIWALLHPS